VGVTQRFQATGTYDDGSVLDLTEQCSWSSTDTRVAAVSDDPASRGEARSLAAGTTQIVAKFGNVTGSTILTVTPAPLTRIEVAPANASLPVGATQRFRAAGVFGDGSTLDITESAGWSSSAPQVLDVSNTAQNRGTATAVSPGQATVRAALGTVEGIAQVTVTPAVLVRIEVAPAELSLPIGSNRALSATGVYDNGTRLNLTAQVTWTSSDQSVARVGNAEGSRGVVTGVALGSARITATVGSVSGFANVTVTAATLQSIEVTPAQSTIYVGWRVPLEAVGVYSDGTRAPLTATAVWSSSDETVATASNGSLSRGYVTGVGVGSATITAAHGGVSGTAGVSVQSPTITSLAIAPIQPSIPAGTTLQFTATAILSDNTTRNVTGQASWTSSDTAVATIGISAGQRGLARGLAAGTTVIRATYQGQSAETTLTVTDAVLTSIQLSPVNPSITVGGRVLFQATGIYSDNTTRLLNDQAVWTSSDPQVAEVQTSGFARGVATGLSPGTTTITARVGAVSGSTVLTVTDAVLTSISVTPTNPRVAAGTMVPFVATGIYSDQSTRNLTNAAAWTSSNPQVAQVSAARGSKGLTTALAAGTAEIRAAVGSMAGTTTLTVTAATLAAVQVTPIAPSVTVGTPVRFAATAIYSDQTSRDVTAQSTWQSSNPQVALISTGGGNRGIATTLGPGTTTISATFEGITGSTTLTVRAAQVVAVSVSPFALSVPLGARPQYSATAIYDDGTSLPVTQLATWSSSNPQVAQVSNDQRNRGQVTTLAAGTTTISATYQGVTGSTTLTVTPAVVTAIQVTPFFPSVPVGSSIQFQATAIMSDQTTFDVTGAATWTSSDTAVAQIGTGPGERGRARALAPGQTTITATLGQVSGTTVLTVTDASLVRIEIVPAQARIPVGLYLPYRATGVYNDQTTRDLTDLATWSSSAPAVADVSNSPGTKGLARGLAAGDATIRASFGGQTGTAALQVTAAVLNAVEVTPASASAQVGDVVAFTASGLYDDGTTYPLTFFALWESSDPAVAQVSNAQGSKGVAFTFAAGTTTVKATFGGKSGTATLVVSAR
jgi:hypothetical protein